MPPVRTQIRNNILNRLKGATLAGQRVYSNPTAPVSDQDELPVICVFFRSEEISELDEAPKRLKRIADVSVEIKAGGPADPFKEGKPGVEDILDDMADEVEAALIDGTDLDCNVNTLTLVSTEFEYEGGGERPLGAVRLTFQAIYYTHSPVDNSKQAGLADFDQANVDWHVGHDNGPPGLDDTEAQDEIILDPP